MNGKTGMRREMEEHLKKVILPFWEGLADEKNGGYTGSR